MSNKYVPKHRAPGKHKAVRPRRALRRGVMLSGVAVAATGVSVYGGAALSTPSASLSAEHRLLGTVGDNRTEADELARELAAERGVVVTRSDNRAADPDKLAALAPTAGPASTHTQDLSDADPRDIAKALLPVYGFSPDQFGCLDSLYVSESNWRVNADNPNSSAYGIPQALTGTHDLPPGYMTSAEVQLRWGLDYIATRYGTPCSAWSFKASHGWY